MIWFVISKKKSEVEFILRGKLTLIDELSKDGYYVWLYEGAKVNHKGIYFFGLDEVIKKGLEEIIKSI